MVSASTRDRAADPNPSEAPPSGIDEALIEPGNAEPGEPRPLLVFLHGLGGSGATSVQALGLRRLALEQGVFVYAPDGEQDSSGRRFWNAHPACCNFDNKPVDDVARLKRAIDHLASRPEVDNQRLYVMGYSNGGFMALRLACEMGERLAAVASVAGAGPPSASTCQIASSIGVLAIHGDRDPIVRYQGGSVFDDPDRPKHGSARETLDGWGKRLHCEGAPQRAGVLDLDAKPGKETRVLRFSKCALGDAELWTVSGASHSVVSSPNLVAEVWRFLAAHSKR